MRKGLLLAIGVVLVGSFLLVACTPEERTASANETGGSTVLSGGSPVEVRLLTTGNSQQTGIWVSGTGTVTVVPDLAVISLGVEAEAKTVAEASRQAAAAMDDVMTSLTANGVLEKDIQTQWFNISPVYNWVERTGEQVIIGYRVTNMVTAKIRDLDKAGIIIDAVAESGGDLTRIQGISFTVDDPTPYYDQAREKALRDAIAKAEQMASIAGVALGKPVYITESGGYLPMLYQVKAMALEAGAPTTPISPGETEISISVQIGYAIE